MNESYQCDVEITNTEAVILHFNEFYFEHSQVWCLLNQTFGTAS